MALSSRYSLGAGETATASPALQEAAALLVAQMPAAEEAAILERLTGVKCSPSTLEREARRQGQRAEEQREALNGQLQDWDQLVQQAQVAGRGVPEPPFTMVVEIDAWNIRERDGWGHTAALRASGQPASHWRWVYGTTCFRLD
jgi:hypothetical protein